jgi:hypothetical protein
MRSPLIATVAVLVAFGAGAGQVVRQTQEDDYTKYELLAPDTSQFRIYYEVTATTPGARFFYNAIRPGSVASDERVSDLSTGQPLKWEIVSGKDAREAGHPTAELDTEYIKVHLPRPVPSGGEVRLLIDKTYKDAKSYRRDGDAIVFERSLGIRRNTIVLPAGYRLISCNVPSQIIPTADGRVQVSFMNASGAAAPLAIRAAPGLAPFKPTLPTTRGTQPITTTLASQAARLDERAHQDREIVYFLNDPATHSFSLYHDYTESRPGVKNYFNVVRPGSRVSNPSAKILDTGEELKVETLKGEEVAKRGLDPGEAVQPDTEVVVISFPSVQRGHSVRLRISETYTDSGRYRLDGDELVWDRAFGRPLNSVVLPAGWTVIASSIPAAISEDADGRQRLYFENNRPDEIQTLIRARRSF